MKKTKEKILNTFENLSIVLTGFSRADIVGTGLLETYFKTAESELGGENLNDLLSAFQRIKITDPNNPTPNELRNVQELVSSETYKTAMAQIIKLWYLGEWISESENDSYIVSSKSYLEGLIWKAIAAHPMGGKQPGYGTWSFAPLTFFN